VGPGLCGTGIVWDRVSDPVMRPKGPLVLCSRSTTIAAVSPTFRKTVGRSSLPSPRIIAGSFRPMPKTLSSNAALRKNGSKFDLHTIIVMPDHAHLLLSALRDVEGWNFSLPQIMHAIKGVSARRINVLLGRSGPVWQEEFFDHVLRSNDSLAEKVHYICQNPVRAGLVKAEGDYRWLWRGRIPVL
jgi:REP element-mobilizing transposase RayT